MIALRTFVISVLLVVGATSSAQAQLCRHQDDESNNLPTLYYRPWNEMVCTNYTDQFGNEMCSVTSDVNFEQTWPFIPMARIVVPSGHYLVTGKVSFYPTGPVAWGFIECKLSQPGVQDWIDIASVGFPPGSAFSVLAGVSLKTPGTLELGCRVFGATFEGTPITNFIVWGANIAAMEVRAVKGGHGH